MLSEMRKLQNNKRHQLIIYVMLALLVLTGCNTSSKEKTLSFYHYDMANKEMYEELAREYSESNEYNVKAKAIPRDSYLTTLQAEEQADIFLLSEEDLSEMLEDKKMSRQLSNLKSFSEKIEFENYFPLIGKKKSWFREKMLALPYNYDIPIILYNKDLFDLYDLEEPENLEEFTEICLTIDENDKVPIGIKSEADLLDIASGVFLNSEDVGRLITADGELSLGLEDLFELASNFQGQTLFKIDPPNNNEEHFQGFINEDFAMFSGTLEDMLYLDDEGINYGYFTMPGYLGNNRGFIKVSSVIGISKKAKNSKEAKNFVEYLLEDHNQNRLSVRANGFTIYPMQYGGDTSPGEIYSFAEELYLSPSLFQNIPKREREIYLKEIHKMFLNEFKDINEFAEELKNQLK